MAEPTSLSDQQMNNVINPQLLKQFVQLEQELFSSFTHAKKHIENFLSTDMHFKKPQKSNPKQEFRDWETYFDQTDEIFLKKQLIFDCINGIGERLKEALDVVETLQNKNLSDMKILVSEVDDTVNKMKAAKEKLFEKEYEGLPENQIDKKMVILEKEIKEIESLKKTNPTKFGQRTTSLLEKQKKGVYNLIPTAQRDENLEMERMAQKKGGHKGIEQPRQKKQPSHK